MDYKKTILEIKFNYRGDEAKAITTLYALVQVTKNVWRAVGRRLKMIWKSTKDGDYTRCSEGVQFPCIGHSTSSLALN